MKKSHLWGVLSACVISLISTHSYATLTYVLGGQAVYDSDADLSWLANANAAVGSAYDTNYPGTGIINWADASAWADGLNINGVTGWRLPDTLQPDNSCSIQGSNSIGYGCTGSEMGNMFYVLGGTTGSTLYLSHNSNYDLFTNIKTSYYWSATTAVFSYPLYALDFSMYLGYQDGIQKTSTALAWAVHDGNVGAAVVPVPAAIWLFGSGLLGLIGIARSKKTV